MLSLITIQEIEEAKVGTWEYPTGIRGSWGWVVAIQTYETIWDALTVLNELKYIPNMGIGKYEDKYEVVLILNDQDAAEAIGKLHKQRSIYSYYTGTEIILDYD